MSQPIEHLDRDTTTPETIHDPALVYYADGTRVFMQTQDRVKWGGTAAGRVGSGLPNVYAFQLVKWDDGTEDLVAPHVVHRDPTAPFPEVKGSVVKGTKCSIDPAGSNRHFYGICDDCDARAVVAKSFEQVEDMYGRGQIRQAVFEAYMHTWATGATRFSSLGDGYREVPTDPEVVGLVKLIREEGQRRLAALSARLRADAPEGYAQCEGCREKAYFELNRQGHAADCSNCFRHCRCDRPAFGGPDCEAPA